MSVTGRAALLLIAIVVVGSLSACVERPPKATTTADDPAGREQCFANQLAVEDAVHRKVLETGARLPSNYGQVKGMGFIDELLWCPAGGDMVWVPTEDGFMECSIHGRASYQ